MNANLLRASISCIAALTLTGCVSYYRVASIENREKNVPRTFETYNGKLWRNVEQINPEAFRTTPNATPLYELATAYLQNPAIAANPQDPQSVRARLARNELQTIMMGLSDTEVAKHLSEVTHTRVTVNMLLGSAALGTAGAGAVASAGTANVLSAVTAGLTGARSLFNEEVYRNALIHTIVASLISKRNEIRAEIELAQEKSIQQYSMSRAINDVRRMHDSGSFYYGLTLLQEAATATNTARDARAQQVRNAPVNIQNAPNPRNVPAQANGAAPVPANQPGAPANPNLP